MSQAGIATSSGGGGGGAGENINSYISTPLSLSTTMPANLTSIILTPGKWMISSIVVFETTSGAGQPIFDLGISTTSATFGSLGLDYVEFIYGHGGVSVIGNISLEVPMVYASVTSPTTYYMVVEATFASGSISAIGSISAVQVA